MQYRQQGKTQAQAAAKAGISVRSGRRIEKSPAPRIKGERHWRTREDPLEAVWDKELEPLLQTSPDLSGTTLLDYLMDQYPEHYDQTILRTLQRRVKRWKALHGPEKEIIFRQQAEPARQGFSDFTHPDSPITIKGKAFKHLLYQFRLAFSGWRSVTVVQGGESYAALSTGLQRALQQAGGSPVEHRTDSLSAARNNLQNQWSNAYSDLCNHYNMTPTRNNPGKSHENGVVECANGSLKHRISQALKLRANNDFESIEAYQSFLDQITDKLNRRSSSKFIEEKKALQGLPGYQAVNYQALSLRVTRSSTLEVRRVLYSVPSQLVGERVQVRLYHDKLEVYLGQQLAITRERIYPNSGEGRARSIDYKHLIHSLVAKPQAFRCSQLRDDILPNDNYRQLWVLVDQALEARAACKWIVTVLWLAYEYDSEDSLGEELLAEAKAGRFASIKTIQERFYKSSPAPNLQSKQHELQSYDALLSSLNVLTTKVEEPF